MVIAGVGMNIFSPEPSAKLLRDVLIRGVGRDVPEPIRRAAVYALQSGGDPAAMGACLAREWNPPTPDELGAIQASVMLVTGDQDTVIRSPGPLAHCLPHARVETLQGIDHYSTPYSRDFHDLAEQFLTDAPSAAITRNNQTRAAHAARKER